jgi:uncharacterized membrane protein
MSTYLILKTLHIISSVVLVGTGFGSAFYLFCANRSKSVEVQAVVARFVVLADWIFTTPAVIVQPVTGIALLSMAGLPLDTPWVIWSIALYLFAGACWLPVVWLQIRMKRMADDALKARAVLPARYWAYARWWECLGYPAFAAMVAVYFLMVTKPSF